MIDNPTIILGPPGTGKTTRLLGIVDKELSSGTKPDRIAFVSFTKKAANEAAARAMQKFNLKSADLPFFRTLHSLAYSMLGLSRDDVMQLRDYQNIGAKLGLVFSSKVVAEDGIPASSRLGDRYAFLDGISRAKCMDPRDVWAELGDHDLNWFEFDRFTEYTSKYKAAKGLCDFADMLSIRKQLDVDVAIIDEAQDLSAAQWNFVHATFAGTPKVYIAGDDDQGIFQWSGAAVDYFVDMPGTRVVLDQSWRIPKTVHNFAESIVSSIAHRNPKTYKPQEKLGSVDFYRSHTDVELTAGTWLLLARNNFLLQRLAEHARQSGVAYTMHGESSINDKHIKAIRLWERLRGGAALKLQDIRIVYEHMTSGQGYARGSIRVLENQPPGEMTLQQLKTSCGLKTDAIWHEALTNISTADRQYYISLLRRGEKLDAPRVHISTIHGVKGGEADHVLLLTDMSAKTFAGMQALPDGEHRVFYVGATRAKESLHVIYPESKHGYFS